MEVASSGTAAAPDSPPLPAGPLRVVPGEAAAPTPAFSAADTDKAASGEEGGEGRSCEKDLECASSASDCECAICYRTYCEPVRAACERHVFCRHCLWRAETVGEPLKCPICRHAGPEGSAAVAEWAEVTELAAKLRARDPTDYDARAEAARHERETTPAILRELRTHGGDHRLLQEFAARADDPRQLEVRGAGCPSSNGVYVVDILPTYLGPTVYRKPSTHFWIYRWHRTQWVIAELPDLSRMGSSRSWLYTAPTQAPFHLPPARGWEVCRQAAVPAPELCVLGELARRSGRGDPSSSSPSPTRIGGPAVDERPLDNGMGGEHPHSEAAPGVPLPRCRCGPPCSIM